MAKSKNETEDRAWELFAANVVVAGQPSVTADHLAKECFKAVAVFEAIANEQHAPKNQTTTE